MAAADIHTIPDEFNLQTLCRAALRSFSGSFRDKEVRAEFYAYIGMTHTIRRRGSSWVIRISDHCSEAPPEVLQSIAVLLACKILRRRPPANALRIYDAFRRRPEIEGRVHSRRLERGRKHIAGAQGSHHALDEIYGELNRQYFNGQVEVSKLGWGARRSWSRLGHYDPVHNTITISPVLDSAKVPRPVVAYLLYHEMLHTLFNGTGAGVRKRHHTQEFYRAEKSFPGYPDVRKFLDKFCRSRGRGPSWLW